MKIAHLALIVLALAPRGAARDVVTCACERPSIPAPRNGWHVVAPSGVEFCLEQRERPLVAEDPADGTAFVPHDATWIGLGFAGPRW